MADFFDGAFKVTGFQLRQQSAAPAGFGRGRVVGIVLQHLRRSPLQRQQTLALELHRAGAGPMLVGCQEGIQLAGVDVFQWRVVVDEVEPLQQLGQALGRLAEAQGELGGLYVAAAAGCADDFGQGVLAVVRAVAQQNGNNGDQNRSHK